jgi:hypothetical protein
VELTTKSTTTEMSGLPTTTRHRSRNLTEDTTASILSDVELTTKSTTTEMPGLPTTTGHRSRNLTEDTTASTLSDVELTTKSTTTEMPGRPTTTGHRSRNLTEDTTVSTLSDVELTTKSTTTEMSGLPSTTGHRSRDLTEDTTVSTLSDVELTTKSTTTEMPQLPTTGHRSRDLTEDTTVSALSDLELTTNSTTTEMPGLPTTTGHRSRNLTEGTTVSTLSDVKLTTNSTTMEMPGLPTTTGHRSRDLTEDTTVSALAANVPILHALRQSNIHNAASGLELKNSTPEFAPGDTVPDKVPVIAPDTPAVPEDGNPAAEDTATLAVSVADVPPSASYPTSIAVSRNNSRIPAGTLRPQLRPKPRGYRCIRTCCFPSASSSRDYYCCRRVGNRFLYYKGTCPVGQGFSALFSSCGFKLRPVLPYLNQQYGKRRTNSLQDPVIWRMTQKPKPVLINLPTPFINENHK